MDEISQIKQNLSVVDVIGGYIEIKKAGRNYKANCPFHSEKSASFMVSPELQIYKCFGCGEAGDIFTFVQKIEGIDFTSALTILAEKAGVKLEPKQFDSTAKEKAKILEINATSADFYHHILTNHTLGAPALDYIKKTRQLVAKTISDFNIGYAPNTWDTVAKYLLKRNFTEAELELAGIAVKRKAGDGYIDKFRDRIMFPLTGIDGKIVGFTGRALKKDQEPKYLNTPETLIYHKSSYLYGLDKAKIHLKNQGVVFVEGQMDVISAFQAGITNVVATSGTSLTINQLKILARYTQDITFAFDSDTAGQNATLRAIELAENEGFNINVAIIPENYADLDELIKADKENAKKILSDPVPIYDFFLAAALKKFDKTTATGKKKVIEEIAPKFAKIKSTVVFDHYIKHISAELSLNEDTLRAIIQNSGAGDFEEKLAKTTVPVVKDRSLKTKQEYIHALLFNAPLEIAQNYVQKLNKKDFTDDDLQTLFAEFKDYIIGRKHKFNIKYFSDKLSDNLRELTERLYMWDLGDLLENEAELERELKAVFNRIKQNTVFRELAEAQEELKKAELEKNFAEIENLSQKVYKLSKQKNQYD